MATTDFKTRLRALRDKMPSGYIQEICKGDNAKRVALQKIFNKDAAAELTKREKALLDEFLAYAKKQLAATEKIESQVTKLAEKL